MQTRKELYESLKYNPRKEWIYPSSTIKLSEDVDRENK
jgi:hypothetical protein